ncbi:unnamed protein product [Phytophthora fragariaefolia]|uniref:Unnamed protein product n=1 Tax=Phytophthora fragariaefolia TaxID=1490495 RepID=A0A9W6XJ79_9STRA|nr:unnamed protein product [Phytophthora fragariaefolia]
MKRAVLEARRLKRELALLRQEKDELRIAAQKSPGSDGKNSAAEILLKQQIQTLTAQNKELEARMSEFQQQDMSLESRATDTSSASKDKKIAALENELMNIKLVAAETERKCQKLLEDKREEARRALHENEQLARCTKTLQSQLALLPQLKRQLERANEKRDYMAKVWQKKLEQREQAFLQEEETSKQKIAESAALIAKLAEGKQELQVKLNNLELKLGKLDCNHTGELSQECRGMDELETSMNQLHETIVESTSQVAGRAGNIPREIHDQETQLRLLTVDGDDTVQVDAHNAEHDLVQAQVEADDMLKQQISVSVSSQAASMDRSNGVDKAKSVLKRPFPTLPTQISSNNEDEQDR